MEIPSCSLRLDEKKQELALHGTPIFPCGCYATNLNDMGAGDFPWHWHEELELVMIHQGTAQITAGQLRFTLNEGECAFINSNVLHSGFGIGAQKCILHSFVFHPDFISGSVNHVFMQKYMIPLISCPELAGVELKEDGTWQSQALQYIREAYETFQSEEFGFEFSVRDLLSKVCILIEKNNQDFLSIQESKSESELNRVKVMLNFIHQHYREPIDLKQIAGCVNVSQRECLRSFRRILDKSPVQYLIKYRLSSAAQLLKETNLNITEICERCGFSSPSYFSKMFKSLTGCSPSDYRG